MNEPTEKPKLNRDDYSRMQSILDRLHREALQCGADPLTVAHAVAPMAIQLLLDFHAPEVVKGIFHQQTDILAAMVESEVARVQ